MRTIGSLLLLVSIVSLPACAPTVWDKPGATPAEFSADVERCGMIAEYANRERDANPIAAGDLKQKVAADLSPDFPGSIVRRVAVSHTHDRCMESKGYVASVSGAPRGSRTRTYRPVETANLVATAGIEYYRVNPAADLLRFQRSDPKLAVNQDPLYRSDARAGAAEATSTVADLFADVGGRWQQLFSTLNF